MGGSRSVYIYVQTSMRRLLIYLFMFPANRAYYILLYCGVARRWGNVSPRGKTGLFYTRGGTLNPLHTIDQTLIILGQT